MIEQNAHHVEWLCLSARMRAVVKLAWEVILDSLVDAMVHLPLLGDAAKAAGWSDKTRWSGMLSVL